MSALARAILAEFGPDDLAELAELLGPYLQPPPSADPGGWMDSRAAAEYLGISRDALQRLTAERRIRVSQERPGARCYFRRSDLDAYRGATP